MNRHEEFYAAIMFIVERHYLKKHSNYTNSVLFCHHLNAFSDASFSENFYGLKRRRRPFIESERATAAVGGIPAGEALRSQEIWRSLLFLVSCKCVIPLKRLL